MRLGIFIVSQKENWGPGKVGLNLVRGLEKKNIDFKLLKDLRRLDCVEEYFEGGSTNLRSRFLPQL